ncbi:regulation of nuclear pre-mRNA domain-containing protein 1B-like [Tigriopus californicus]|uniref:regulation of nuclear pre-mRNA domain-containing protein 1B-like n=1 Tax=Tigriopus californicus TaxID=6832 RepID=UPI0027DA259D|nr:regulation of nuclear pre-mRNA domain-containing protein 1B-like [Tigriopus californicus]
MTGFSESVLEKKLTEMNNTAPSIQQLSLWLMHHKKHFAVVVKTWYRQLCLASNQKKLTFLYLANDVVQNTKKKFPEYTREFGSILKKVMEHLAVLNMDEKTVKAIGRLLSIWKDRIIFDPKVQVDLDRIWATKSLEMKAVPDPLTSPPSAKKSKLDSPHKIKKKIRVFVASDEDTSGANQSDENSHDRSSDVLKSLISPTISLEDGGSTPQPDADPPDPEVLIKALQDLENAASSDAVVREKIAALPSEVSEVSHLDELNSTDEGQSLLQRVEDATSLLKDYNVRLQQELEERKKVGKMISNFLAAQKDLESQAEERLEQYRDKLEKVNAVREDLKSHIQSLPDLTQLPDVTGGLAPLPSAGDLFTLK